MKERVGEGKSWESWWKKLKEGNSWRRKELEELKEEKSWRRKELENGKGEGKGK